MWPKHTIQSHTHTHTQGRFIPHGGQEGDAKAKRENETHNEHAKRLENESVAEEKAAVDTEINIQLGDFTLKARRVEVLQNVLPVMDFQVCVCMYENTGYWSHVVLCGWWEI
jgi:hypothetical protein